MAENFVEGSGKYFESPQGTLLTAVPKTGHLEWKVKKLDIWEKFDIIPIRKYVYNVKSYHGKYLCAQPDGSIICNREKPDIWEEFEIKEIPNKPGFFRIKTYHNTYVSYERNGYPSASYKNPQLTINQVFRIPCVAHPKISKTGEVKALKSYFGKFLTATSNGRLEWTSDKVGESEIFQITKLEKNKYTIKSAFGRYLSVEPNNSINSNCPDFGDYETFEITKSLKNWGCFYIRSHFKKYLSAQPNGSVECNRDVPDIWEYVTII